MAYTPRYAGPIQVAADHEGRHLAEEPFDSRLRVASLNADVAPDLVIVRAWRPEKIKQTAQDLSPATLARIAEGRAVLVLDASGEGPAFDIGTAVAIHKMLREVGVPSAHVVYLTQNRAWEKLYRAFCFAQQVEPVGVLFYDYYIRNVFRRHETDGAETFQARLAAFRSRGERREKRFVCLNFTPRPAKTLLLLKLIQDGLFDQGFISFSGFDKDRSERAAKKSTMMVDMLTLPGLEDEAVALLPLIETLAAKSAPVLGATETSAALAEHNNPLYRNTELDEYNRAWFTVVTESEVYGRRRITEKPFKAFANFTPYLTFGNPGSLELAREFGFRTFDGPFDEAYDAELDLRRRFQMLYGEISRLCTLPETVLRDIEAALAETLTFNAHHALVTMPAVYRDTLEPQLIDSILDARTAQAG